MMYRIYGEIEAKDWDDVWEELSDDPESKVIETRAVKLKEDEEESLFHTVEVYDEKTKRWKR